MPIQNEVFKRAVEAGLIHLFTFSSVVGRVELDSTGGKSSDTLQIASGCILAPSEEEAVQRAVHDVMIAYPAADGWKLIAVTAGMVGSDTLEVAYASKIARDLSMADCDANMRM